MPFLETSLYAALETYGRVIGTGSTTDADALVVETADLSGGVEDVLHVFKDESGVLGWCDCGGAVSCSVCVWDDGVNSEETQIVCRGGERVGIEGTSEIEGLTHDDQATRKWLAGAGDADHVSGGQGVTNMGHGLESSSLGARGKCGDDGVVEGL